MKNKKYVLMTIEGNLKYEGFVRNHFKLFDSYLELQKHLQNFWFINKDAYIIFEETKIKKDYSINDVKKDDLRV